MLDVDAEKNQQELLQVLYSITANYIFNELIWTFIWTNQNFFDLRKHYAKYFHTYFDFYILMELEKQTRE